MRLEVWQWENCCNVEWDPQAPITPPGQLVFFAQFLAVVGFLRMGARLIEK